MAYHCCVLIARYGAFTSLDIRASFTSNWSSVAQVNFENSSLRSALAGFLTLKIYITEPLSIRHIFLTSLRCWKRKGDSDHISILYLRRLIGKRSKPYRQPVRYRPIFPKDKHPAAKDLHLLRTLLEAKKYDSATLPPQRYTHYPKPNIPNLRNQLPPPIHEPLPLQTIRSRQLQQPIRLSIPFPGFLTTYRSALCTLNHRETPFRRSRVCVSMEQRSCRGLYWVWSGY
jgi:hypothetical protein